MVAGPVVDGQPLDDHVLSVLALLDLHVGLLGPGDVVDVTDGGRAVLGGRLRRQLAVSLPRHRQTFRSPYGIVRA